MPCPDVEELARTVARGLVPDELLRRHLASCASCGQRVRALITPDAADSQGSGPTYIPEKFWADEPTDPSGKRLDPDLAIHPDPASGRRFLARGRRVGRYDVLEVLGWGGAGVVYAAYDPELDRRIALKLLTLSSGLKGAEVEARARLLREAQAMARLVHPNVVTVHDVGDFEDTVFIAMEFVGGGTLRTWMATPRPPEEILEVLAQVGRGLAAAHGAGLVHRDLKPENVLVATDGTIKVSDFGLARAAGSSTQPAPEGIASQEAGQGPLHSPLTLAGAILGTPGYIPPEQVRGGVSGPQSDQFSFCVTAWEALYGQRPFTGQTLGDLALAALRGEIRPPPCDTRVPRRVHAALLRGLAAKLGDRFPTMKALLAQLAPSASFTQRHWLALARSATVIAASLLLGGAYLAWKNSRCDGLSAGLAGVWDPERKSAVREAFLQAQLPFAQEAWTAVERATDAWAQQWTAQRVEACEATLVRGEQSEAVMRLRQGCLEEQRLFLRELGGLWSEADRRAVEEAALAASGLPDPHACSASRVTAARARETDAHPDILQALSAGRALLVSGAYQDGLAAARRAQAGAEQAGAPGLGARAQHLAAVLELKLGNREAGETTLKDAARAGVAAGEDEVTALSQLLLLRLVSLSGRLEQARELEKDAAATVQRLSAREDLQTDLLLARGDLLRAEGRLNEALSAYQEALERRRRLDGPRHPGTADLLVRVGVTRHRMGMPREGIPSFDEALEIQQALLGADHPEVARVLVDKGNALYRLGEYQEATRHQRRALEIREAALGDHHVDLAGPLSNLGVALSHQGQFEEALRHHQRALAIARTAYAEGPRLSPFLGNTAEALLALGRTEEARAHATWAVDLRARALPPQHLDHAGSLTVLAETLAASGKTADALAALTRAQDLREQALGENHYLLAETLEKRARVLLRARQPALAVAALERAVRIRRAENLDPHLTQAAEQALAAARAAQPGR